MKFRPDELGLYTAALLLTASLRTTGPALSVDISRVSPRWCNDRLADLRPPCAPALERPALQRFHDIKASIREYEGNSTAVV